MKKTLLDQNINVLWASLIIDEITKNGITKFFISPGNRNAPIISALAYNEVTSKKVCFDERSAGYMALGHAKATGLPGVAACTSGTALANYFPAVIEAYRDGLPLVILSSDRPPELLGSDANQTADQEGIYGRYCLEELNLPCPSPDFPLRALLAKIDHILQFRTGPVHINCHFRDPLVPSEDPKRKIPESLKDEAQSHFQRTVPYTSYPAAKTAREIPGEALDIIRGTDRGLLVIGRMHPHEEKKNIPLLMKALKWPVFCDIGSSLKHAVPAEQRISGMDHPESLRLLLEYSPDTVLHLGSGLVSKQFYDVILRKLPLKYIQVNRGSELRDPAHRVNVKIHMDPDLFAGSLAENCPAGGKPVHDGLMEKIKILEETTASEVPGDALTFPAIVNTMIEKIPAGHDLFLGNSLTIREFDRAVFSGREVAVVANRGVSGIEGNISTALGYAEATGRTITAVIGDLSFLHDLNALAGMKNSPARIVLIVVNNHGGRIFERLPIREFPAVLDPYITAPHALEFKSAADLFGIPYARASSPAEMSHSYEIALQKNVSYIIEAPVSGEKDLEVFYRIKKATIERSDLHDTKI